MDPLLFYGHFFPKVGMRKETESDAESNPKFQWS